MAYSMNILVCLRMKSELDEINFLILRNANLEIQLRDLCNLIMKIKRQADKKGMWISAGVNPYVPLTDESQQGPLVTSLYEKVEEIRKVVRKI